MLQLAWVRFVGFLFVGVVYAGPPSAEQTRAVLARLGKEADQFEANAHRYIATETLRQTQPEGTRFSKGPRGIVTGLPAVTHEIVSEYGFISSDEPGGSLKEVRSVLTVNGLKWKRGKKDLNDLANRIAKEDAKNRVKSLEAYESHGLRGFLSDAGQVILLFARRGAEKYEITFEREQGTANGPTWVYKYQQIDGNEAVTIYGGKEPIRQRLTGEVWLSAGDGLPVRVTIVSEHQVEDSVVRDVSLVDYEMREWGLVLPVRIDHRQYVDGSLFVVDEFRYSGYKPILAGKSR